MDNNMKSRFAVLVLMAVVSSPIWADTKTVTLNVPGMTCPACPITIKKALNKVQGVSKVDVSYERKQAVVTFDDTKTDTKALVKATTNAGYPSNQKARKNKGRTSLTWWLLEPGRQVLRLRAFQCAERPFGRYRGTSQRDGTRR